MILKLYQVRCIRAVKQEVVVKVRAQSRDDALWLVKEASVPVRWPELRIDDAPVVYDVRWLRW